MSEPSFIAVCHRGQGKTRRTFSQDIYTCKETTCVLKAIAAAVEVGELLVRDNLLRFLSLMIFPFDINHRVPPLFHTLVHFFTTNVL